MNDNENATSNVGKITYRLPFVSARKPHRCEAESTPKNPAPAKIPFCCVVIFKSHCTTGNT